VVTATQKAYEELQKNLGNAPSTEPQAPSSSNVPVEQQQKPKFYAPIPNEPGPAIRINPQQNNLWNDPANLIGAWTQIRSSDEPVDDAVIKDIRTMIDYYRTKNPGKQWYEMDALDPSDPMAGIFAGINIPFATPVQPATIPVIQPEESISTGNLWNPAQATTTAVDMTLWTEDENLPDWQKWAMGLFSQPGWVQGAAQGVPWAILGAMAGAGVGVVGGPGGMALGAAVGGAAAPLIAGGLIGYFGDPAMYEKMREQGVDPAHVDRLEHWFKDGLVKMFMFPGEAAEQYIGANLQAAQAIYESAPALPDVMRAILSGDDLAKADAALKLGPMAEIINDFPAVIEAARLTYEAWETALPAISNVPAAIEMGAEKIGETLTRGIPDELKEPDVSPVFAKPGQVHILGQPEPITLDAKGMAILKMLREDIKANPNIPALQIVQEYQEELGFSGQAADMFYQSLLDPLNFVEAGSGIILGKRAGAKGLAGDIAKGVTKTERITGDLLRAQIDGTADISTMSKMDLELARLTPEGQLKDLQKPVQMREFGKWMTELTPEAKAKASLDMLQENQQIMFELARDLPELDLAIKAWGEGNTANTTKAVSSLLGLPEYKHLRDFMLQFGDKEYKKIRAMWDAGEELGYRAFIKKVADELKISESKVLADIKAGDAKIILDKFKASLKGDAAAAVDGLTVRDITAMQEYFQKSPLTFKELKEQIREASSGAFEKWAVKHYDLKPPPLPIRLAHMLKSVQSALVLGLNPGYAMTNITDNSIRLRTEGMPLFTLPGEIGKYFGPDGFDIKLSRMDEGYGVIGVDPFSKKGAITEAMRSKGIVQSLTDAARKAGEFGPATKISSVAEKAHTRLAKYGTHKKVWPHLWNSNTVPVPDAIRTGLSSFGTQAGKAFDTVIASAKKASDLELDNVLKKLDDDFTYKRADNYIGDVTKDLGIDTQLATSLLEQSGALDYLNDRLSRGESMVEAKNATRKMFDDFIHDAFKEDVKTRARQSEARVKVEGWSSVLDLFSEMGQALDERVTRHSSGWTEVWDAYETLKVENYDEASSLVGSYKRQTGAEWTRLKEWRASTWEGVLKGLGFADNGDLTPDANAVMKPLRDTDAVWDTFFTDSDRIRSEHAAIAKGLTTAELNRRRTEMLSKLSDMYQETSAKELANMREMGDAFNIMWQNQGLPGIDEAKAWWDSMATLTEKRQKFMTDMRNYERGEKVVTPEMKKLLKDGGSKKKLWPLFYEKVLLPLYAETIKANDDGDAFKEDVKTRARQSEARVKVEGWSSVLDLFSEMGQALDERVTRHSSGWTEAWDAFDTLRKDNYKDASSLIGAYKRQTGSEWTRLKEWRASTWEGVLKGLGFADKGDLTPDANAVMKPLRDTDAVWDTFYTESDRIWGEHAAVAKDLSTAELKARRTEILTKLSEMYAETSAKELANMREMGDAFNIMWQNQGLPGIDEAKAWWDSMATLTEKRQKFMTDMRNYERGEKVVTPEMKKLLKDGGSKKKMWPLFYEKVLLPLYAETIKANDDGIKNVISAAKKDGGPAKPLPPDARLLHKLQEQAKIEHDKHVATNPDAKLTDMEIDRMVDEGWTRGKKGLFNAVNKDKREAGLPTYKKIGDVPMSEALQSMRDRITKIDPTVTTPETAAMGPSIPGTVDKTAPVNYISEVFDQGVGNFIDPLLNGMAEKWKADITKIDTKNIDPETIRAMKNYLADAQAEFSKRKLATMKVTDTLAEEMLLNYNKKYNFDVFMDAVFPYQFWYTRSMLNWGARMIDKPQIFSMYYRLLTNLQNDDEDSNMPYRMRGKIRIPADWLPEEFGGGIFVDPWSRLFSFHQMNSAIDQMAQENNQLNRETESILYDMVKDELITVDQRKEAIADKESELWKMAYSQAKGANGKDLMDMVSLAMQPAMYLQMPWNMTFGDPGETSELPHTRFLQGLTGLTGTDFTKMDYIGKAMYGIGVKEFGEWGDYYIKSQLAWMVFEGKIDVGEAEVAMVEKQGEAWDAARQRVMESITVKQPLLTSALAFREKGLDVALGTMLYSWLPGALLPQGELIMRGLKDDYDKAWDDYNSGDLDAVDRFYEEHPEYKIRTPLYMDDQQEMLRRLMYNNITDAYYGLPVKLRDQVNEELGDDFVAKLIDKETRDIDAVDMETLATWSRRLGGYAPKDADGELIRFEDEEGAQVYQDYIDTMKEMFPEKKFMDDYLYSLPEAQQKAARANMPKYQEIWDWQKQYAVEHPEVIPFIVKEGDPMFGQPPEVILEQYKFEVEEMKLFPELDAYKQRLGWDNLTNEQKSVLYDTDDMLRESSAWRSSYLMEHPELIQFNISEDSRIAGLDPELQQAYYLFYSERDRLYPNISKTWEELYALPKSKRSSFYNAHPELNEYSEFKKAFYEIYPELENVINPPEDAKGAAIEKYSQEFTPPIDLKELPPYVVTSMYDYYTSDENLSLGSSAYLRYYWEQNGKPLGAFSLWIDSLDWMFTGQ